MMCLHLRVGWCISSLMAFLEQFMSSNDHDIMSCELTSLIFHVQQLEVLNKKVETLESPVKMLMSQAVDVLSLIHI